MSETTNPQRLGTRAIIGLLTIFIVLIVGLISWLDIRSTDAQPMDRHAYMALLKETIQRDAVVRCSLTDLANDDDCPALGPGTYVKLTAPDQTSAVKDRAPLLPEGQPVILDDYNNALLEAVAHKQWPVFQEKGKNLYKNEAIEQVWYAASRSISTNINDTMLIDDKRATLSLWRFGDTVYVMTGTQESSKLTEPVRTIEDVEGARSWNAQRIHETLKSTTTGVPFQAIVLVDGSLYRILDDGYFDPEPSLLAQYPDTWGDYVVSIPKPE